MKTLFVILFSAFLLSACGGGESSSGTQTVITPEATNVTSGNDSVTIVKGAEED